MNLLLGLLIIAIGALGQSSSYVPIKKVKGWSWESFWLIQGVFAWLVFPFLGALLAVPEGSSLCAIFAGKTSAILQTIGYGVLWGVGGLTFGLSMRYLGVALGQSIALGTCSAFGTLFPALMAGRDLFSGQGLVLLIGVAITLAGIAVIGFAGGLREKDMTSKEKQSAVTEFALTKGLLVALLAGLMSACFALGLEAGSSLTVEGVSDLYKTLPATLLVTIGGLLTNASYCLYQNAKNKTFGDYVKMESMLNNVLFCALAGGLWYSQFFGLGLGKGVMVGNEVMLAFSWSILMSLNVLFSNLWGILLKEWKGVSKFTILTLSLGLGILIFSLVFPSLF